MSGGGERVTPSTGSQTFLRQKEVLIAATYSGEMAAGAARRPAAQSHTDVLASGCFAVRVERPHRRK